jgi:hypothetical protein
MVFPRSGAIHSSLIPKLCSRETTHLVLATMCGIFFSLSASGPVLPNEETCYLLRSRGPDSYQVHQLQENVKRTRTKPISLAFVSTVLSMRGDHVVAQPLVDATTQSVLCWNGDAWKVAGEPIRGNDTQLIFNLLLQAVKPPHNSGPPNALDDRSAVQRVVDVISSISGPFSFVFYDAVNARLYFTRDCLGRRSLLQGLDENGALKICSLCDGTSSTHFEEVATTGVHMIDFTHSALQDTATFDISSTHFNINSIQTLPWESIDSPGHLVRASVSLPCLGYILMLSAEKPYSSDEQIYSTRSPPSARC